MQIDCKKVLKRDNNLDPNMIVAIRIRPMLAKEVQQKNLDIVVAQTKLLVILFCYIVCEFKRNCIQIVMDPVVLEADLQGKKMTDVLHRNK